MHFTCVSISAATGCIICFSQKKNLLYPDDFYLFFIGKSPTVLSWTRVHTTNTEDCRKLYSVWLGKKKNSTWHIPVLYLLKYIASIEKMLETK